jgi:methyl-accepting chemotaxis protein
MLWEPNALDGRDAEFAGRKPEYDATGRYMPYFSRGPGGSINVEPSVPSAAIDVYDVPRVTRRAAPYPSRQRPAGADRRRRIRRRARQPW